jgi:hypothetical protein
MTFSELKLDCPENSVQVFNKIVACGKLKSNYLISKIDLLLI